MLDNIKLILPQMAAQLPTDSHRVEEVLGTILLNYSIAGPKSEPENHEYQIQCLNYAYPFLAECRYPDPIVLILRAVLNLTKKYKINSGKREVITRLHFETRLKDILELSQRNPRDDHNVVKYTKYLLLVLKSL